MLPVLRYTRIQNALVTPYFLRLYFLRQWKLLFALALFLVLTVAFHLGAPLLLRFFLDAVIQQAVMSTIFFYAALYVVAAFALRGVRVGESYLAELVAWKATNALRIDLVRHCLTLDLSFHLNHTPGELIERIDGDVGILNNFFSRFVLVLITNALIALGVIAVLTTIEWRMGLLYVGYAGLYVAVIFWLNTATVANFVRAREAEAALFGFLEERLSGTEDMRTNGATGYVLRQLTVLMRQRLFTRQHAEVVQGLISIVRMIFRLYDPQQGRIFLNGVDSREVTVQALCSHVGLVTQDVRLFYASLRDIITFLDRTIADATILEAIQRLGLAEWFARLPDGLETQLQADSLSAG